MRRLLAHIIRWVLDEPRSIYIKDTHEPARLCIRQGDTVLRSVDDSGATTSTPLVNPSGPFNTKAALYQAADEARKSDTVLRAHPELDLRICTSCGVTSVHGEGHRAGCEVLGFGGEAA